MTFLPNSLLALSFPFPLLMPALNKVTTTCQGLWEGLGTAFPSQPSDMLTRGVKIIKPANGDVVVFRQVFLDKCRRLPPEYTVPAPHLLPAFKNVNSFT